VDCPLFKRRIEILEQQIVQIEVNQIAPVSYLQLVRMRTVEKNEDEMIGDAEIMRNLKQVA